MTKIGGALGARVQSVTAATAAVAGNSQTADVTAPTTAAASRANKCWSMRMKRRSKLVASGHSGGGRRGRVSTILVGFMLVCTAGFRFTGGAVDPDVWLTIRSAPKHFAIRDLRSAFRKEDSSSDSKEVNLHSIDEQPKEAAISLLRTIAYHKRHSRRAEERDLEERLRYHEASRKDAEELLALYQRRWPEEAAGRLEYVEAKPAEAGQKLPKSDRNGL